MNYLIIFILLFAIEILYFKLADKFNIIDKPNERSSHTNVTLRGGGIIFYFGALTFFFYSDFQYPYFFLGLTAISLISFLDDIFTLSNKLRLFVHLSSVMLMFYELDVFMFSIAIIVTALILVIGTINAYNFMDGINGITVANSIVVLGLLAYVNSYYLFVDGFMIYAVLLSCLVFAYFNFRDKAKCFAGDVGSVAMAFILIFLITKLIITTGNLVYILFLAVYGIDTVWTIIHRLLKRENIFKAHRTHLYQYLANEYKMNKLVVAFSYGFIQLVIGMLVIWASSQSFTTQIVITLGIIIIGSLAYLLFRRKILSSF